MKKVQVTSRITPELDPQFVPAALWNREFRKLAATESDSIDIAITLERANGAISRFDSKICQ